MDKKQIINLTAKHIRQLLKDNESAHDWWHIYRVWKLAKHIAKSEVNSDIFVVELTALLHDIADWKFHEGDESIGPKEAKKWLDSLGVDLHITTHVSKIIETMSYKGAKVYTPMKTIEGKIVQDADRLDAIGAIGIARTFNFGGFLKRPIYDPDIKPEQHKNSDQYKSSTKTGTTINHFYEKLLLLKDRLNTKTAKSISLGRHKFMEEFLKRFYSEWEGRE